MKNSQKTSFRNQLERIRISKNLSSIQVARLLGFQTSSTITRFEKGLQTPDLKMALKLALIYDVPIRVMLHGYYEACRDEVRQQAPNIESTAGTSYFLGYCSFEKKLEQNDLAQSELRKIRNHSADIIRKTGERLGHI